MKKPQEVRRAGNPMVALTAALPIAVMLLPDLDYMLSERRIAMSKIAAASENQPQGTGRTTPPARDPVIAVEEEYQLAQQQGTAQALELFIARHPDSPQAKKARADLGQKVR